MSAILHGAVAEPANRAGREALAGAASTAPASPDHFARLPQAPDRESRAGLPARPASAAPSASAPLAPLQSAASPDGAALSISPATAILLKAIAVHEAWDEADLAGAIERLAIRVADQLDLGVLARAVADHNELRRCG